MLGGFIDLRVGSLSDLRQMIEVIDTLDRHCDSFPNIMPSTKVHEKRVVYPETHNSAPNHPGCQRIADKTVC
jgi:hypothetical protein